MPAGKAMAGQADKMPAVLASISPLAIAITIAVAVLLALAIAFGGRVRARLAQAKQPPRLWYGGHGRREEPAGGIRLDPRRLVPPALGRPARNRAHDPNTGQ